MQEANTKEIDNEFSLKSKQKRQEESKNTQELLKEILPSGKCHDHYMMVNATQILFI